MNDDNKQDNKTTKNFDIRASTFNIIFTQMTADKGIELLGEQALAAIYKEYK